MQGWTIARDPFAPEWARGSFCGVDHYRTFHDIPKGEVR